MYNNNGLNPINNNTVYATFVECTNSRIRNFNRAINMALLGLGLIGVGTTAIAAGFLVSASFSTILLAIGGAGAIATFTISVLLVNESYGQELTSMQEKQD